MNFDELIGVARYIYLALIGVTLVQVYSNCEIMSFRSKASHINAENDVRIKQEACANLPLKLRIGMNMAQRGSLHSIFFLDSN